MGVMPDFDLAINKTAALAFKAYRGTISIKKRLQLMTSRTVNEAEQINDKQALDSPPDPPP